MTEDNYPHLTDDEVREKFRMYRQLQWSTKILVLFGLASAGTDMLDGKIDSIGPILGILVGSMVVNYLLYYWGDSTLERKARERNDNK